MLYKIPFVKKDIEVITEENAFVHVSGHANREDLKDMYQWVKPKCIIPVHGEHRHMKEHINFAQEMQIPFNLKVENGDIIKISKDKKPRNCRSSSNWKNLFRWQCGSIDSRLSSIKEKKYFNKWIFGNNINNFKQWKNKKTDYLIYRVFLKKKQMKLSNLI